MIKVSDYIAKRLKETYKIKNIFMVTGGNAMHLNDSFGKYIPYTCFHHEQAAAMAAEGYNRECNKLAVVNVTSGPGGLNCLNGVFGQWTDSISVLYISGQVKRATLKETTADLNLRQLGDQEADIISIVSPITKYAIRVTDPTEIKYHLEKAVYEATSGRKGPVWLDIPIDVQGALINENELIDFTPQQEEKYDLKTDEVIKLIEKSQKPLVICGHGIRLAEQIQNFKKLIERLKIPFVTTLNGNDILPTEHELNIGRIGTIGQRAGNFALQNADLILCLGTRNNIRQVSYNWENFAKNATKIMVDIDKSELNKPLVKPDLAINADLKDFIPKLINSSITINAEKNWLIHCQNLKEKYSFKNTKEYCQKEEKINPYYFVRVLSKSLKAKDTVVATNATATIAYFQSGMIKNNQRFITNSGDASMGYGLPASIGAEISKLINKSAGQVICLEGDGSIMMNIQELQTIKHYSLPIKIFIINNKGYSSCKQTQTNHFNGHFVGAEENSGVSMPDFTKLGNAFEIKSVKLNKPENIEKTIKEVLMEKGSVICEVMTDENCVFTPKLSSKRLTDGTMQSPSLEDMYPFLNDEEMKENIL